MGNAGGRTRLHAGSNLQRQILHNLDGVGDRKVDSAKKTIVSLNPDVDVVTYDTRLSADNVFDIIAGYDVTFDGADRIYSVGGDGTSTTKPSPG